MEKQDGFSDWSFKFLAGGFDNLRAKRRIKKLGLTGVICFDKTNIHFEQYFKPTKPNVFFQVGLLHSYICAN